MGAACVVVTTVEVGAAIGTGGGGAETTWDSGSEEQPAKSAIAPQTAKAGENRFIARLEGVEVLVFIPASQTPELPVGSRPTAET
jgi:hypothetical protein